MSFDLIPILSFSRGIKHLRFFLNRFIKLGRQVDLLRATKRVGASLKIAALTSPNLGVLGLFGSKGGNSATAVNPRAATAATATFTVRQKINAIKRKMCNFKNSFSPAFT